MVVIGVSRGIGKGISGGVDRIVRVEWLVGC